ncbi:unnamed protein product [Ranitomeya imitator]|uniref:Reverse transcriptase domain-containing protein n=1 Tax=Ranitomeya imitator TaxID=111125 RepID=A0ABN9M1J7_9NEOB|nr:unnamed protein product [Ranitomeya imitator]
MCDTKTAFLTRVEVEIWSGDVGSRLWVCPWSHMMIMGGAKKGILRLNGIIMKWYTSDKFISFVQKSFQCLRNDIDRGSLFYSPNLTPEERMAVRSLKEDSSIIMKPADKGGALVIMDKSLYILEIMRQLSDTSIYLPLQKDPTSDIRHQIDTILKKYTSKGVIDSETCEFLQNKNPIIPVFYTLPKVHKNLRNIPGRPIVTSTNSILSPLAIFLEKVLTPIIQKTDSFILDTGAFFSVIQGIHTIPLDSILVTLDVKDLYTSIPHNEGINSTSRLLRSTEMDGDQVDLCIDLVRLILTSNFFLFQDNFYLQIRGTAMGSNVAPQYANAYMADFEENIIYKQALFRENVIVWKRYIDDVFCIWEALQRHSQCSLIS